MPRFYLRLALLPIILLTAALLVIRSQPIDDHELRELLLSADCPAPCLMGIRPGVTTMDEAVAILEANRWVGQIDKESNNFGDTIKWTWNNQIPKRIISTSYGQISGAQTSGIPLVDTIMISSFLQLEEAYVVLGPPDTEKLIFNGYSIGEQYGYVNYMALYHNEKLFLIFDQACRTGYPNSGNGEIVGLPFTIPVHILVSIRYMLPASGEPISIHSPIHHRPACGS